MSVLEAKVQREKADVYVLWETAGLPGRSVNWNPFLLLLSRDLFSIGNFCWMFAKYRRKNLVKSKLG